MANSDIKVCTDCGSSKPIDEFRLAKNRATYTRRAECKSCEHNRTKLYRKTHKEQLKGYYKQWSASYYKHNTEKVKAIKKKYYEANKQLIHQRMMDKVRNNINLRLASNLRHRIWCALKNNVKSKHTMELLGCSIIVLKEHLEFKFQPGMNWDNYGHNGWHVDHIIPCTAFDLSKKAQQKHCFHYTNLQPLWEADNIRKGGANRG